jgi:hypothetical protein
MLAFYRWIVGCALLFSFFGCTLAHAKSIEVRKHISERNPNNRIRQAISGYALRPTDQGMKSYGLTDFGPDPAENNLFDIFCSGVDTRWLRPGESDSGAALQRLRNAGPKPATPIRGRVRLRPC